MIEIVESVCSAPLRFLPSKSSNIKPGDIVELTEEDGNPCCKLSDGTKPFGIVSEIDGPFGMISVWFETMVLKTDNYEKECVYSPGKVLYVSAKGKLTSVAPHPDAHRMGHVITAPGATQAHLEVNWI